jgi:hypothetical protein
VDDGSVHIEVSKNTVLDSAPGAMLQSAAAENGFKLGT